jgi:hypothetical protein
MSQTARNYQLFFYFYYQFTAFQLPVNKNAKSGGNNWYYRHLLETLAEARYSAVNAKSVFN